MTNLKIVRSWYFFVIFIVVFAVADVASANPVFPGAIGFGTDTKAAYGAANDPIICIVTNINHSTASLNDSTRNGVSVKSGSLLACINYTPPANKGKVILFEVSGTIHASSSPYEYIVDEPHTTIAGQTSPSPGITLRNIKLVIKTNDVLIQHIRSRVGDAANGSDPQSRDALSITAGPGDDISNVVVDHCSFSWAVDENIEVYNNSTTSSVANVTISNSIIAEGLKRSIHPKTEVDPAGHSKGIVVSGWPNYPSVSLTNHVALLNNIIAHCTDRTPRVAYATDVVVANNLSYNNEWFNSSWAPTGWSSNINLTGNVGLGGPNSGAHVTDDIMTVWQPFLEGVGSNLYLRDNRSGKYMDRDIVWNEIQSSSSDWSHIDIRFGEDENNFIVTTPKITIPGASYLYSADVIESTTRNAGARPNDRDTVDTRIINDIKNGTGKIIDSPSEVGGWPNLAVNHRTLVIPSNPNADDNRNGYTNMEEWLHTLAAEVEDPGGNTSIAAPIAAPIGLKIVELK